MLAAMAGPAIHAAPISLTGQLDPGNPQDAFVYPFTVSSSGSVTIQSWGYGGSQSAPGGRNAAGAVIAPGGFDPYVSLFRGSGASATFVASNDDGLCPPGTPASGNCFDSTLTVNLAAGTYTLAITSFLNMSFAENLGTGTLGDGFIGLGSFGVNASAFAVDISGANVVAPARALAFTPNGLTFGPQTLNTTSGQMTVTVTSVGTAPVTTSTITVSGANAGEFTPGGNCTQVTLAPGATCTLSVTFRPTALGVRTALVTLNSDANTGPLNLTVNGTGTSGAVATAFLSATDLAFGNVVVDALSAPRTVVITNTGSASLTLGSNLLAGANAGDFIVQDGCAGKTLGAGQSCTLTVFFLPHALGPRTATYTFNSTANNNPVTITFGGTGVPQLAVPALSYGSLIALALLLACSAAFGRRTLQRRNGD